MRSVTHPASVALGIATLGSLFLTGPLVSSGHDDVYHFAGSGTSLFVHVALEVCLLWLSLTGLLWLAARVPRLFIPIWCALLLSLPYFLLKSWASFAGIGLPHGTIPHEVALVVVLLPALGLAISTLLWRSQVSLIFGRVQPFAATVLGFTSLFGLVLLVRMLDYGWQARALNATPQLHQRNLAATSLTPPPRVIWILLDELSFQQVYEQRFPGLSLPAFDRLAAKSTVFTHTIPAGNRTTLVIPSLMTGLPDDGLRISGDGQLHALHNPTTGAWQPFDPHQTIFQDALDHGYSTALAGWYNPYCRILPQVLDRCFWTFNSTAASWNPLPLPSGLLRNKGEAATHIGDYQALLAAGDALLADPSSNFIFLHMPIPHPGGIFDRRRQSFTTGRSSYIDNLALADQYLAHVRTLLEQRGQWDTSAIIVMGDHSWRTYMWAKSPDWTPEDQAASHGRHFDDRPAYIVKLPHQQTPAHIDTPFAAVRTRALMDAILTNRLQTPADLQAWAEQQP